MSTAQSDCPRIDEDNDFVFKPALVMALILIVSMSAYRAMYSYATYQRIAHTSRYSAFLFVHGSSYDTVVSGVVQRTEDAVSHQDDS